MAEKLNEHDEREEDSKLEETTQERLDEVFSGDSTPTDDQTDEKLDENSDVESDDGDSTEKTDDGTAADESEEKSKESSDDSTPTDDQTDDGDSTEKTDDGTAAEELKGISDAYYRAAKHQGWEDKDIEDLYKTDPDLANRTFSRLLENTNRLSQEFASIGRSKQQQQQQRVEVKTEQKNEIDESKSDGIDIEKLRKDYDNDPIVDLIEQQQKQYAELRKKVDAIGTAPSGTNEDELRVKLQEEENVNKEIQRYFNADDLKQYSDFYGIVPKGSSGWDGLTTEQKTKRVDVLELADQILTGAEMQGRKMDVSEALESAHLVVSEPQREKIIREDIKSKVVERAKGLTLRPNSGTPQSKTGKTGAADLEATTEQRLAKVFNK